MDGFAGVGSRPCLETVMSAQSPKTTSRKIYRLPEVIELTGYGRSAIYEKMKIGEFPQARKLGPRAVGWCSQEIDSWINAKLEG